MLILSLFRSFTKQIEIKHEIYLFLDFVLYNLSNFYTKTSIVKVILNEKLYLESKKLI